MFLIPIFAAAPSNGNNIGLLHGFETGWINPDTSCGPSVISSQVSIANEGGITEEP